MNVTQTDLAVLISLRSRGTVNAEARHGQHLFVDQARGITYPATSQIFVTTTAVEHTTGVIGMFFH